MNNVTYMADPTLFRSAKPNSAFANLPDESLADGIGSSYGVIGYKGKNWSLRYRGEIYPFTRPDDGSPINYIDVVILRQARVKAKSYYPDGFDEHGSSGKRPVCASIDGERPDPDAQTPQANVCALCPRNTWYTDQRGKKTKDCSDYKRLAVLILPAQTARAMGQPLIEAAFLRVPPASLNDLAIFGETMHQQGWPFSSFVTRISFDPQTSHPKFVFKALHPVGDPEAPKILALRDDVTSRRITGEDEIEARAKQAQLGAGMVAQMAPPQQMGLVTAPVTQQAPPAARFDLELVPLTNRANDPEPRTAISIELTPQTGGFFGGVQADGGMVIAHPRPVVTPSAIGQSADDVGNIQMSGSDIDAKIKSLLPGLG